MQSPKSCAVLHCLNPADTDFYPHPEYRAYTEPVCSEHGERLQAGERWMIDAGETLPRSFDDRDEMPGIASLLVMGTDLPPAVTTIRTSRRVANEPGIMVTLDVETADGPSTVTLWFSEERGNRLAQSLTTAPQ
jgi:hypothetical protein